MGNVKDMKILCLCSAGNSRSAGTRIVLTGRGKGYDVIAAGVDTNTPETIALLSSWADKILVAVHSMGGHVPGEHKHKIDQVFFLGEDVWGNPLHPELHKKIKEQLDKRGL